ncbi:MAG: ATP-binding cassette domain-containing protein [Deltaproteobacteria bacterium]|jgi:peptide/nickel transport system ATP-binding protein|nr:ATP-binding cassette domain-containing protein [Deltaproteobacteria bacterium]
MKLEASSLYFSYSKKKQILSDLSFVADSHERVGIVAPSGAGKTTLCRILAGYIKPQKGQVLLDGQPLHKFRGYCPIQMIWQHPENSVNPKLRIKQTLNEGDHIDERIISGLGLEPAWYNRFPGELSGGEIQRFCIARALGQKTKFLIADEITTMLDLITQSQIWSFLLQEITERKIGLIAVTHSDPLMEHVATRTVAIERYISPDEI